MDRRGILIKYLIPAIVCYVALTDSTNAASWRIVGGTDAKADAYPFIVSLRGSSNIHFCAGTILNTKWILTASHCVIGRDTKNVKVVTGTNTLHTGGTTMDTNKLMAHDDYDGETMVNDISVIRLTTTIIYTDTIRPVTLSSQNVESVDATLIGWGGTSNGGGVSNNLQELSTETISYDTCKEYWQAYVTEEHICALAGSSETGACDGDSGGPLIRRSDNVQIGIASFVLDGGCAIGFPDVHTRVSSYIYWIISTISSRDGTY